MSVYNSFIQVTGVRGRKARKGVVCNAGKEEKSWGDPP
jgi:hypothetical protein